MRVERRDGYRLVVGGPVPRGSGAITLGRTIVVRREHATSSLLLAHEKVHVRQWRRYGTIPFVVRYLGSYVYWRLARKGHRGAYLRIPFEIEAEWLARRLVGTRAVEPSHSERTVV